MTKDDEGTATPETNTEACNDAAPVIKRKRGFALMSKEKILEISSKGGKAAVAMGKAHRFTSESAAIAGKKGGSAPHVSRGRAADKAST